MVASAIPRVFHYFSYALEILTNSHTCISPHYIWVPCSIWHWGSTILGKRGHGRHHPIFSQPLHYTLHCSVYFVGVLALQQYHNRKFEHFDYRHLCVAHKIHRRMSRFSYGCHMSLTSGNNTDSCGPYGYIGIAIKVLNYIPWAGNNIMRLYLIFFFHLNSLLKASQYSVSSLWPAGTGL